MQIYDHKKIEVKWRKVWLDKKIYQPDLDKAKRPFYNLMMFPYPSAEGLHVGNMYAFTGADVYGRFKRMQGYDVFEPIGLDGFGIHSENYALKVGKHPEEQAKVRNLPGSLEEALNNLANDHQFLLKGDVFTKDVIETWIDFKIKEEVRAVDSRPHPYEFFLYYDM